MPTEFNAATGFGLFLFFVGGLYAIATVAQASRLAVGIAGWKNMGEFFAQRVARRNLMIAALLLAGLGGLIACSSVMVGDANRNALCDAVCERSGLQPGRFRTDPHGRYEPGDEYECWCKSDEEWSAEPVAMEEVPSVSGEQ